MNSARFPALASLAMLGMVTAACAGSADRYPSLSLRDFERIGGQFPGRDSPPARIEPDPLPVTAVAELETALSDAQARHGRFLAQARQARGVVAAAAGSSSDEKRWTLAMVEMAALDSQHAATTGLLADLDALYADATLEFHQRQRIVAAQASVGEMVRTERAALDELVALLGTPRTEPSAGEQQPD